MTTTGRIGTVLAVLPAVLLACLQSAPVRAEEPIAILYNDRPPYQVTHQDGSVSGLSATPAAQAFKIAGIPVIWVRVPTNRQLSLIKHDSEKACALGWFRKPDREQYAKFTVPIYRDKPTVALSGARFTVPAGTTLAEVLARKGVRVLVKDLYSYGPYIDDLLKTLRPDVIRTTSENHQMVQMIQAGRADFHVRGRGRSELLHPAGGAGSKRIAPAAVLRYVGGRKTAPDVQQTGARCLDC